MDAQREAVRKQLEDGVEAMYQEALNLYRHGEFSSAADRFKDVQDIIPGYKHSGQYMDEARMKALTARSQSIITSDTSDPVNTNPPTPSTGTSAPVGRPRTP